MEIQKQIFDHISKNEINELKGKLTSHSGSVDFFDENGKSPVEFLFSRESQNNQRRNNKFSRIFSGMTPLQHASYKGSKEAVQLLLDLVSSLSSFKELCKMLI